ncbi:prolyl aminopeptidase [Micromonospora sagamiensis]|uniref:Proline iminopeptidase n=1 Tax=Micromonospora sagamiensis TaxID=47875 RepID=A0A562WG90_9ACTN|nr:prolyl aminopeptidase [Micromonospora sagamiensis]TWJ29185.1 proline iminopeptidase [Micromonospora sagamiensis]BCL17790.1 proline iminopeptidase [Micromonospora sagamiensis]
MHPTMQAHAEGMLDVGDGHQVFWQVGGNPDGKPAVVLHGGPGSGSAPGAARVFDPARYRIVFLDQRGCGRSTPNAGDPTVDLSTNTTDHLVADVERLREHLGVDRWLVLGASWGSSLALAYAQRHPRRVSELVLFSVTLGTRRDVEWILRDMGRVFPAEWARFRDGVPPADRDGCLADAYARLLADSDPAVRERAARDWCAWEDTHVTTVPGYRPDERYADPEFRMVFARLVTHYWRHGCFLDDGELLRGAHRLSGIPGVLVHGRLDISSPADGPWQLAQAWPDARLVLLDADGHGSRGPDMVAAVTAALDEFAAVR